ncbi:MAG: type I-E CRISPR-associated endoribonuclease Cas2e [Arcanobacterium sp.]|nr:type I-E CRISPR-associated endoribonuclease Cas2e [Arcanobacterium sp.]MDY5589671.1 type I-E CRISPR-associated endoribonuclease Cas2e [Arcanobacterium sp.]
MFAVVSVVALPDHVCGYISRFLTEAHVGLYAGVLSRRVADEMWERIVSAVHEGSAVMVCSDPTVEQGFTIRTAGREKRSVVDCDGIALIGA